MSRRGYRDRVVGFPAAGDSEFYESNRMLPRRTYRDFEGELLYSSPSQAVYRESRRDGRMPAFSTRVTLSYPVPAKRSVFAKSFASRGVRLQYPVLRVLNKQPMRVRFCVQRKTRREVLFALRRAGYSGSAPRSYSRSANSNYGC